MVHRWQRLDLPVHGDPGRHQAGLKAVAQRRQHRGQVAIDGLHRVHRHAQLVQRRTGVLLKLRGIGLSPLEQAEQAHQLGAHAVMDVAHDALALLKRRALRLRLLQGRKACRQLLLAFMHLLVQGDQQALILARLADIALHDEPAHHQDEAHRRQRQERKDPRPIVGHSHHKKIPKTHHDHQGTGQRHCDRLTLAQRPCPVRDHCQSPGGWQSQKRQGRRPQGRPAEHERRHRGTRLQHAEEDKGALHDPAIDTHQGQRKPCHEKHMQRQRGCLDTPPQRPGQGRLLPQAIGKPDDAQQGTHREIAINRIALQAPQAAGNGRDQGHGKDNRHGPPLAPHIARLVDRIQLRLRAEHRRCQPAPAASLRGDHHLQGGAFFAGEQA